MDLCGTCQKPADECICKNKQTEGMKFDGGDNKLRWDLLHIDVIEDVVNVLTKGSKKYSDHNWKKVPNGTERYYAAMMRHIVAWRKGELYDKETNLHHLSHAICCAMFLQYFDNTDGDK